jgi:hypothetical protein
MNLYEEKKGRRGEKRKRGGRRDRRRLESKGRGDETDSILEHDLYV